MNSHIYSDLAIESAILQTRENTKHPELSEYDFGFAKLSELSIDDKELSDKHRRPIGRYITITTEQIWMLGEAEIDALASLIENEIVKMISELVPSKTKESFLY